MNRSSSSARLQLTCPKLRSKEMYHDTPGEEDEAFSSGLYWCLKTHESFGPDGKPVGKEECCEGRGCYDG